MNGVEGLDPDTSITQGLGGYGERSISHGIEHGNDFTDRVVSRRNCYHVVIGGRDHIGNVRIVAHDLIGYCLKRAVMEVMVGFRYLSG